MYILQLVLAVFCSLHVKQDHCVLSMFQSTFRGFKAAVAILWFEKIQILLFLIFVTFGKHSYIVITLVLFACLKHHRLTNVFYKITIVHVI